MPWDFRRKSQHVPVSLRSVHRHGFGFTLFCLSFHQPYSCLKFEKMIEKNKNNDSFLFFWLICSKLEKTFPMEVPSFEKELNSYKKGQKVVGYPIKVRSFFISSTDVKNWACLWKCFYFNRIPHSIITHTDFLCSAGCAFHQVIYWLLPKVLIVRFWDLNPVSNWHVLYIFIFLCLSPFSMLMDMYSCLCHRQSREWLTS